MRDVIVAGCRDTADTREMNVDEFIDLIVARVFSKIGACSRPSVANCLLMLAIFPRNIGRKIGKMRSGLWLTM